MKYIITTVWVEMAKIILLIVFVSSWFHYYPILLICAMGGVDDYVINRRRKWPQRTVNLSRTFNNFSNWAHTAFGLHLLPEPHNWSPSEQNPSVLSFTPHSVGVTFLKPQTDHVVVA